jgi:LCP family protein required for cell wall assembly
MDSADAEEQGPDPAGALNGESASAPDGDHNGEADGGKPDSGQAISAWAISGRAGSGWAGSDEADTDVFEWGPAGPPPAIHAPGDSPISPPGPTPPFSAGPPPASPPSSASPPLGASPPPGGLLADFPPPSGPSADLPPPSDLPGGFPPSGPSAGSPLLRDPSAAPPLPGDLSAGPPPGGPVAGLPLPSELPASFPSASFPSAGFPSSGPSAGLPAPGEPSAGTPSGGFPPSGAPAGFPPGGPPPGRRNRKKILAWASGITAGVVAIALVGSYVVYRHFNSNLHQVNISGDIGTQPADLHPQAENIVVLGSDTRKGVGHGYGSSAVFTTDQSDTLMIVHIAADRKWADIMSIPRDSWVNIPACRMGNGQLSSPTTFKINEAFAIGNLNGSKTTLGIACTVKTLEQDTGIHIDHFVAVNFTGFRDMVNSVGGVPECNTKRIDDPNSHLYLSAGHHVLDGTQALGYVRARYTLGNGSDLERIGRQQAFMSSLVDRAKSRLYNPVAIYHFLDAATKSLTIDQDLGGMTGIYRLATSVRNLPASQVTFFTLPTYPRSVVDPTDMANVLWTQPAASLIFQAFRNDVPVSQALLHPQGPAVPTHKVSVIVLNGTQQYGLQDTVGSQLQLDGFRLDRTGTAASQSLTQTVIRYHAGDEAEAQRLSGKIPGAALRQVPGTGTTLTLVLGSDYGTTTTVGNPVTPQPAPSFSPRTATQNICT